MMQRLILIALLASASVQAREGVEVCFNYGCAARAPIVFEAVALHALGKEITIAGDAPAERRAISRTIGALYRLAGQQSPIAADRRGNLLDRGVHGRMDCIDHSTSTTGMLQLIAAQGWLRFHEVREPARRARFIFQHFSAVIEEIAPSDGDERDMQFVVDSWFVDHGEPAVVMPLAEWLKGEGPNVQ